MSPKVFSQYFYSTEKKLVFPMASPGVTKSIRITTPERAKSTFFAVYYTNIVMKVIILNALLFLNCLALSGNEKK